MTRPKSVKATLSLYAIDLTLRSPVDRPTLAARLTPQRRAEIRKIMGEMRRRSDRHGGPPGARPEKPDKACVDAQDWAGGPAPTSAQGDSPGATRPSAEPRPFVGFDQERAAYERLKPDFLSRARGKYVVLVGDAVEGPVETFEEALRAGYRRFGLGPLYIKQVVDVEPVSEVTRDVLVAPCES